MAKATAIPGGCTGKNSAYLFKTDRGYSAVYKDDRYGEHGMAFDGGAMPEGVSVPVHGTSIFDPVLCELAYRWFCPEGGAVLDPFAGGSVRGIVAAYLGYRYTGVDLSERQIEANRAQWAEIGGRMGMERPAPVWIVGDSRNISELAAGEYDFILSCPPYADLERYSDDPEDLSTLDYPEFLAEYRQIIAASVAMLKPDRAACFVVGDVRDKNTGAYHNFVSDTIRAFLDTGCVLYNEAVLVTAVGSLPVRVGKQFGKWRKLGKTHQNVLVFWKGDTKRIHEVLGEVVEFGDVESDAI